MKHVTLILWVVNYEGLQRIINDINPSFDNGPWICGGYARKMYLGEDIGQSDIDIWFKNDQQYELVVKRLKSYNVSIVADTKNAETVRYYQDGPKDNITIQYIKQRRNSVHEILDNFDISICQIATNGHGYILSDECNTDLKNKQFRFTTPETATVSRLIKYMTYGYTPVDGTKQLLENNNDAWKPGFVY